MLKTKVFVLEPISQRKVPGILIIDDKYLYFKSTDLYYKLERKIPLNNIVQAGKRQKFIFFSRFFYIRTREGSKFRFYTFHHKKVVQYINRQIHNY